MVRHFLYLLVFGVGLAVVAWVGIGYLGGNPLGALVAGLIGVGYLAGALELWRYRQSNAALQRAIQQAGSTPPSLADWLQGLPDDLRGAVRLRVEGARVGLPAPTLTPYLAGLLVLLGMLGTLLGMMATLRGTGLALESATDLQAIRASLAGPVKGLGFAFGTSIAGVASSAMLGLLSALARRERLQALQQLDARIATTLRHFSRDQQREQALHLQQQQLELMPALLDRLQTMVGAIEQQQHAANERQAGSQEAFHQRTEALYRQLGQSLEQSLREGVSAGAQATAGSLQPLVETTLQGLRHSAEALHSQIAQTVQLQLQGIQQALQQTTETLGDGWASALQQHQHSSQQLSQELREVLQGFARTTEQHSTELLDRLGARFEALTERSAAAQQQALTGQQQQQAALVDHWQQALRHNETAIQSIAASLGATLADFSSASGQQAEQLLSCLGERLAQQAEQQHHALAGTLAQQQRDQQALSQGWQQQLDQAQQASRAITEQLRDTLQRFADHSAEQATRLLDQLGAQLQQQSSSHAQALASALEQQRAANATRQHEQQLALQATLESVQQHNLQLIEQLRQSQGELQRQLVEGDQARLAQWHEALSTTGDTLAEQWQRSSRQAGEQQQAIADAMARTADTIGRELQQHASATIAEIARLAQTAAEAPKAAAEVVAELRQRLSDSMVRDTAMLEERSHLMATLKTLLDALNQASGEQREAIEALLRHSGEQLAQLGQQVGSHIEAQSGKLELAAAQLTDSAVDIASLGDAFAASVQAFGHSSEALQAQLAQVASALQASLSRSDEQLAYYVAQAREVVDLSVLSQKQIIEDLQQLAVQRDGGKRKA